MTNEEAKEAFLSGVPIIHKDDYRHINIHYSHISAIIYRRINGRVCVSVELADRCGHSVTIAPVKNIFAEA